MARNMREIILASASPRRTELLRQIGLEFEVDPSPAPEPSFSGGDPHEFAVAVSLAKAKAVADRHPNAVIIAADTFGIVDGRFLGKPHTEEEARRMLADISGRPHDVITGLTVMDTASGKTLSRWVTTRVYVRQLDEAEIAAYAASGEPLDKAGAYAIQGRGAALVERIEGDYANVVGLPLAAVSLVLKEFGIEVLG
jgi:septum formation protein